MATTTPPQWDSKRAKFARILRCRGDEFPRFLDRLRRQRKIQLHFGASFVAKRAKFEGVSPREGWGESRQRPGIAATTLIERCHHGG